MADNTQKIPAKEKMEAVGVRFPVSVIEWLAGLKIGNAVTPSDKIRAIVAQARLQSDFYETSQACLAWAQEVLSPLVMAMQSEEAQGHGRFEALALLASWLPPTLAAMLASAPQADREALQQKEKIIVGRCFQLLESFARLALCHDLNSPAGESVMRLLEQQIGSLSSVARPKAVEP
ncbi:MAG: hypothetical protein FWG52_06505 [Proteobacteria bacterium]|nr:hypothetical protein [Pseudomonadota bacterium]